MLADDHSFFRTGLRRLLEAQGFEVLAEAADGEQAVEAARRLRPDVLLVDLDMPGVGGIEAARRTDAAVLVLTGSADERDVVDALAAGAIGYLLKDAGVPAIVTAIRRAADGDGTFSPGVAALLAERVRDRRGAAPERAAPALTVRERDVLRLLATGRDNAAIAAELGMSAHTAKEHVSSILRKLGVENRVQAAVWAARHGLVAREG